MRFKVLLDQPAKKRAVRRLEFIAVFGALSSFGAPAFAQSGGAVQLNEIVVDGTGKAGTKAPTNGKNVPSNGPTGVRGYTAEGSSTATKTNTPLVKVPQSVTVITREQLSDRNVQTINEAVAYTAGVQGSVFGYDPRFDQIFIRGFDTTYNGIYRDGLRLANAGGFATIFHNEPYGLDAITILRGPSGSTYGFGSPGGIVDLTSKRPVFTQFGEIQLQVGNYARKQGNFDIGGPVAGTNDTVAYRLTGTFRDADAFPTGPDDRINIAPAFTYRPDGSTSITFLSEYQKTRLPGSVAFLNGPNFTLTNVKFGDPAFNTTPQEQYRVGYAFEHEFSKDLIVRQNLRYSGLNIDYRYTAIDSVAADGLTADRSYGELFEKLNNFAVDNQVEGHFNIGPTKHVMVAGLDYSHSDFSERDGFGTAPPLNLVTLNYGQQYIAPPAITNGSTQTQDQLGVYLQDQIEWNRFTLTLSGRHDSVTTDTQVENPSSETPAHDQAFTGRAGLNYRVIDGVFPYVSYATTFIPNLGVDLNRNPFAPTRGDQKEVGVKTQVPNTNLHINAALFDITATNILRTDPTNVNFQSATGEVRSRGYEVEAIDNIAPGTNLIASYTHLDLRTLVGATGTAGKLLSGIPGDQASGFAKYQFQTPGALGGLSFGGGARFTGWSFGDDTNTGSTKGFTLFDAVAGYDFNYLDPRFKGVSLQVNATNVFDRYAVTCQSGFCYRVAPAMVIGTLAYRW